MAYLAKFNKNGNIKLGGDIWSFNKLAGSGIINGCKGSCGKYCVGCYNEENPKKSDCYVFNGYIHYGWDKSTVVQSHIRNTQALREDLDKSFEEINTQIRRAKVKPVAIRIHSSGEMESVEEFNKWLEVARNNPSIPIYTYTKAFDILESVFSDKDFKGLPSNFYVNISVWHENGIDIYNKWKHLDNVRAFVYMDNGYTYNEDFKVDAMCPAYDSKGKMNHNFTCANCKICYQGKAKVCGCHSH